jgi:hypothetical protein
VAVVSAATRTGIAHRRLNSVRFIFATPVA